MIGRFAEKQESKATIPVVEPTVVVSAIPSYRLVVSPREADLPSRLIVLHARIETRSDDVLRFKIDRVHLVFPDGKRARVLDPPRAVALLRKTDLALADLSYARTAGRGVPPGGISNEVRQRLEAQVLQSLLDDGELSRDHPLEGYLVIDTLAPRPSLEGLALEVTANRVSDALAVSDTYQFAGQPRPSAH